MTPRGIVSNEISLHLFLGGSIVGAERAWGYACGKPQIICPSHECPRVLGSLRLMLMLAGLRQKTLPESEREARVGGWVAGREAGRKEGRGGGGRGAKERERSGMICECRDR